MQTVGHAGWVECSGQKLRLKLDGLSFWFSRMFSYLNAESAPSGYLARKIVGHNSEVKAWQRPSLWKKITISKHSQVIGRHPGRLAETVDA